MLRFLIISLEILAVVAIVRSSFAHYLFGDTHQQLADWMLDVAQIAERKQLAEFREQIVNHVTNLSDSQLAYLTEMTASKSRLADFNRMYCESNDKNPYIYGATLHYTCEQIASQGLLKS